MVAKKGIFSDAFEQIVELGQSTVKTGAKQVAQTFNPLELLNTVMGESKENGGVEQLSNSKKNSTPLQFNELQKKYQNQDKLKADAMRNRLFQMVKQGELQTIERKKQEQQQKIQQEEYQKTIEKRNAEEQKRQAGMNIAPKGKERKSIFSEKKVAERNVAETKPATGKQ